MNRHVRVYHSIGELVGHSPHVTLRVRVRACVCTSQQVTMATTPANPQFQLTNTYKKRLILPYLCLSLFPCDYCRCIMGISGWMCELARDAAVIHACVES